MEKDTYLKTINIFIANELEAEKFYRTLAKSISNDRSKKILLRMSAEESGHAVVLEKFKEKSFEDFSFLPPEVDMALSDTIEQVKISDSLSAEDVLKIAIKKEEAAVKYYKAFSEQIHDPEIKELCQQMINMELLHKNNLENEYLDFIIDIRGILDLPEINLSLKDLV